MLNVGVPDSFRRFALLPDADQRELLRDASKAELGLYLARARPSVRKRIIGERGHLMPGQGVQR